MVLKPESDLKLIKANGSVSEYADNSLKSIQAAVGGLVEVVDLPDGRQMFVNEDGLWQKLPVNVTASNLAGERIVGDVVVAAGEERWT